MGASTPTPGESGPSGPNAASSATATGARGDAGWVRGVSWTGGLAAGIWGYQAGVEIAGLWLGLLMALNLAVCAALLLTSVLNRVRTWVAHSRAGSR